MSTESSSIVQRVRNYCHVLRGDGVCYRDYVEQFTYLFFLKMVDEQKKLHSNRLSPNPDDLDWSNLKSKVNLDIFWLKDESLEDSENLPEPDVLAQEIVENLQSALEQFSSIYEDLSEKEVSEQF